MRPIVALALPTLLSALDLVDRFLLPAFSVDIVAELQLTTLRLQDLVADELRSTMTAATILAMTLVGTSAGNALVGWLADAFRGAGLREPLTHAGLVGLVPWALAIPCLAAARRAPVVNAPARRP